MNLKLKLLLSIFLVGLCGLVFVGLITFNSGKQLNEIEIQELLHTASAQALSGHPLEKAGRQEWAAWINKHPYSSAPGLAAVLFDKNDTVIAATSGEESAAIINYIHNNEMFSLESSYQNRSFEFENWQYVWVQHSIRENSYSLAVFYIRQIDKISNLFRRLVIPTLIAGGFVLWASVWIAVILGNLLVRTRQQESEKAQIELKVMIEERTSELVESEALFKDFAEASSDWFWEMDSDLKFTYFSENVFASSGVSPKSIIGKTREELLGKNYDRSLWAEHLNTLKNRSSFRDFEYCYDLEGEFPRKFWIRSSGIPIFNKDGSFAGYRGSASEITQQKEAANRLRLLASAMEAMSEGMVLFDPNDQLIICNSRFREINASVPKSITTGITFDEHLRAVVAAGLVPESVGREEEWIKMRLERHKNPTGAFELLREDDLWLMIQEERMEDGSTIIFYIEISDLKQANIDREAALTKAEKANRAKSEFLATMSHEFRTPLNAIIGFSGMLQAQYFGPLGSSNYIEYANDIHRSGEHMLALVNDVLDVAAIEAGKRFISIEAISVQEVLADCIRNMETMLDDACIELICDTPDDLPVLNTDKRSVVQIILNLLSNAIKFTERNGSISVSAKTKDENMLITVSDTGIGIPSDRISSITEPFSQSHSDPHKAQDGTGLGLSIVKSIVDVLEGSLHLNSQIGEGTTVTVTLPLDATQIGKK
jgi:PAS domain S-box-containing protein